ncbi:MAG: 30S ribosomal protein S12 methylthiotransferase RimO [Synergistaceae bacterium]|jgi:ribosomal protein S12 methylthiotransferase|nr:30S ribosomal protein S12 methylthiotransferase RimO [Synergistaceae bacterium]
MKIYILSLGCAKNKVDSECLAGELKRAGHTLVEDVSLAEVGIVNTCGFIRPAVEESVAAILDLEQLKHEGKLKKIGVVGCLVNRYSGEMNEDLPEVDFWADSEDWGKVLTYLGNEEKLGRFRSILPLSSKHTRYLKISEGCNNHCTFCTIPSIRGDLRSLPIKMLVSEAEQLVSEGARELCLVGQDLTVYGTDIYHKSSFIELLDSLESSLPKDIWIRLLYLHPARVTTQLLERISSGRQILPYLDVPIQHGDSRILSAMNRGMSDEELLAIFKKAREINPDFALRTTCMVGFPGEKKQHFDKMIDFISEVQFDRMGAFTFFAEEGTKAYEMSGQVSEATKKKRLNTLMAVQEEISFKRQQLFVGREVDVLLENVEWEYGFAEGRSFREAPEVDGLIEIRNIREDLKVGDIIKVQLKEAMPHDMVGEEVEK